MTSSSYDADAGYLLFLLQQLGWIDLIAPRQIQEALMVFKALNGWLLTTYPLRCSERSTSSYVLTEVTLQTN